MASGCFCRKIRTKKRVSYNGSYRFVLFTEVKSSLISAYRATSFAKVCFVSLCVCVCVCVCVCSVNKDAASQLWKYSLRLFSSNVCS